MPFEPGDLVAGRFDLVEILGQGGTSVVFEAVDRRQGRRVALKVLRRERLENTRQREGFFAEAEIALRLRHRHLVGVEEIGFDAGLPFLVMRRVRGTSLRERLKNRGALALPAALATLRQIALGVGEIHRHGFVHGDLKPDNVLLDERGEAVLIDFGIAGRLHRCVAETSNTVLGTLGYLSPEQARGEALDARSDLYNLGLLGLEMLTGNNPFAGGDVFQIVIRHMLASEAALARLEQKIPARARPLLHRCLAPAVADRYASADELVEAIETTTARRGLATALPRVGALAASLAGLLAAWYR